MNKKTNNKNNIELHPKKLNGFLEGANIISYIEILFLLDLFFDLNHDDEPITIKKKTFSNQSFKNTFMINHLNFNKDIYLSKKDIPNNLKIKDLIIIQAEICDQLDNELNKLIDDDNTDKTKNSSVFFKKLNKLIKKLNYLGCEETFYFNYIQNETKNKFLSVLEKQKINEELDKNIKTNRISNTNIFTKINKL